MYVEIFSYGDMEPEEATYCSQAEAPGGGRRTPNHPQNFRPKTYPVQKKCKDGAETKGKAHQ